LISAWYLDPTAEIEPRLNELRTRRLAIVRGCWAAPRATHWPHVVLSCLK
jgi:hypothetical protein